MEAQTSPRPNRGDPEMPGVPTALSGPLLPVLLTGVLAVGATTTGLITNLGQLESYALYGVANVVVLTGLHIRLSDQALGAIAPFHRPSARELGAAVGGFVAGLLAYQLATRVNAVLGTPMEGMSYSLTNPTDVGFILFGAVLMAPLAEEILFRGLLLGHLINRGYSSVTAGLAVVVAFAVIHLPNFGVGGAVFILLWGPIPTALRLWFDNLTGAWLMHTLNNTFAYVIVAGVLA